MPDDLGNFDVEPVDHNPFGSVAQSPNDYDVQPVDHDPFGGADETQAPDQFELVSRQPEAPAARNMPYPGQFDPSGVYAKPPLDPRDRDLLIKTVYGEASDQPTLGQAGVAHAILNRVRAGGYGQGIEGVVHAGVPNPRDAARGFHEFSPWNPPGVPESNPTAQNLSPDSRDPRLAKAYRDIGTVVDDVYADRIPDPTHGATHYYGYMPHPPKWAPPLAAQNMVKIGGQTFVGGAEGPGRAPVKTAGGYAAGGPVQQNAELRRRLALISRPRFADGGGPDDIAPTANDPYMGSEESSNAPEVTGRGPVVEGDRPGQGGSGPVGRGYPAAAPEGQPGAYSGGPGGVGVRPGGGGSQAFAPVAPDAFHQAISAAKAAHPDGAQVALYSPEEYAQTRPFLSPDGKSGFALNDDDIISVFRHPDGQRGAAKQALNTAVANGGRRLDAFDTYLPKIYSSAGFKPVARLPFDDQYAPEGWDYEHNQGFNGGRPDVVFMVHDPENASHVGGKPVASYDEGVAAQREALKEIAARPLIAPQLIGRPPSGLLSAEEHLQRQREGLEEPGDRPREWTGGRVGYASGGPVQQNAFLRRRVALISRPRHGFADGGAPDDPFMQNAQLRAQQENEADQYRQAHPDDYPTAPAPSAAPTTWYGKWGQTLGDELSAGAGAVEAGTEKLGQFGASIAANPVGYGPLSFRTMSPESEASLGRDLTGMLQYGFPEMAPEMAATRAPEAVAPRVGATGSDVSAAAAPARAQVMDINGVKRHIDPEFPESRVGTSVPWKEDANAPIDAGQAAHANNDAHVGMDLASQVPSYGKSVANMVRSGKIPYVKVAANASDAAAQEALIEHMKNNLLGLYNRVSGAVRSGSRLWYEGANSRSANIAVTHDIPHENAAGVVASLSPQKDWDQNVALADWVAHTAGTTADDTAMSPQMTDWVNRYALRKDPERVEVDPETGRETRYNARTGEEMSPNSVSQQDVQRKLAQVQGKPWGQMTPDEKAFYTRAYYEAHGPPDHLMPLDDQTGDAAHWIDDKGDRKYGYYINNPDGTHDGVLARYGDEFPNKKGQPIPVSWGSTGEVANAIKAFGAQSMSDISEALGGGHKVRSFFNNIIAPWSRKGDVTSDTHAVAAALLRPLGAGSPEAASGMGAASPGNAETGLNGFYPHVAEAYRRAAKEAGVLPRELQSITWEALRGLWSPREKSAKSNVKKGFTSATDTTNGIWQRYKNGQMSMDNAHNAILGPQGENIDPPRWFETFQP